MDYSKCCRTKTWQAMWLCLDCPLCTASHGKFCQNSLPVSLRTRYEDLKEPLVSLKLDARKKLGIWADALAAVCFGKCWQVCWCLVVPGLNWVEVEPVSEWIKASQIMPLWNTKTICINTAYLPRLSSCPVQQRSLTSAGLKRLQRLKNVRCQRVAWCVSVEADSSEQRRQGIGIHGIGDIQLFLLTETAGTAWSSNPLGVVPEFAGHSGGISKCIWGRCWWFPLLFSLSWTFLRMKCSFFEPLWEPRALEVFFSPLSSFPVLWIIRRHFFWLIPKASRSQPLVAKSQVILIEIWAAPLARGGWKLKQPRGRSHQQQSKCFGCYDMRCHTI